MSTINSFTRFLTVLSVTHIQVYICAPWCMVSYQRFRPVAVSSFNICLQARKWPKSKQWEVNVHKQSTWLIWLISSILSSLVQVTQYVRSSQQGRRRELEVREINWLSWPTESDSCYCLCLKSLFGGGTEGTVVGI